MLALTAASAKLHDILISFRFAEAHAQTLELQKALEARGKSVFVSGRDKPETSRRKKEKVVARQQGRL